MFNRSTKEKKEKRGMEINKIYNENCLDTMAKMSDNFINLTVTSPPYDNLRTYNGYCFDFQAVAKELYRVTKQGGVVVWVVGDATVRGSESGTSFRQALFFKECGFNLHDTMIWEKTAMLPTQDRYYAIFEYMFVFSKGKPNAMNFIDDKQNTAGGRVQKKDKCINKGKQETGEGTFIRKEFGRRTNIWRIPIGKNKETKGHPAVFPEQLANDHIVSWSNENDLVYDPFIGSGTTAKMAIQNNRKYIGSEISKEYCEIINNRIFKNELF
jgi:site-specific DNA-methyltransferase (adenine-specific)